MEIYFQIIWKRLLFVIGTLVITVAVAMGITLQTTPYYVATTKMLIQPFGLGNPEYGSYLYSQQLAATLSQIIESYSVTLELAEEFDIDPDDMPNYSAAMIPDSELLQLSVTGEEPELVANMANRLAEVLVERVTLQYGANLRNIEQNLEDRVAELEIEIDSLIRERSELINDVPVNNVRLAEIDRLLTSREGTYSVMLSNLNETLLNRSTQSNLISIFELALVPEEPAGPRKTLNLIAGIVVGIVAGIGGAFLLEIMQPKLYTKEQVETVLDAELLSTIPKTNERISLDVTQYGKNEVFTEPYRRLGITLEALLENRYERNSVAIFPIETNVDNASIFLNLSVTLAKNHNRVVIVDTVNRDDQLQQSLKLNNELGLADVLHGEVSLEESVQSTIIDNLYFISTGDLNGLNVTTTELFASDDMSHLIKQLEQDYDYVLLRAAPLLGSSSSLVVARRATTSLLIMRADTNKRIAEDARNELERIGVNVLGTVIYGRVASFVDLFTRRYAN